jgi:hypothetical protein
MAVPKKKRIGYRVLNRGLGARKWQFRVLNLASFRPLLFSMHGLGGSSKVETSKKPSFLTLPLNPGLRSRLMALIERENPTPKVEQPKAPLPVDNGAKIGEGATSAAVDVKKGTEPSLQVSKDEAPISGLPAKKARKAPGPSLWAGRLNKAKETTTKAPTADKAKEAPVEACFEDSVSVHPLSNLSDRSLAIKFNFKKKNFKKQEKTAPKKKAVVAGSKLPLAFWFLLPKIKPTLWLPLEARFPLPDFQLSKFLFKRSLTTIQLPHRWGSQRNLLLRK